MDFLPNIKVNSILCLLPVVALFVVPNCKRLCFTSFDSSIVATLRIAFAGIFFLNPRHNEILSMNISV